METFRTQGSNIEDPMNELDYNYIVEQDEKAVRKYKHDPSKSGNWILFFKNESMYSMWEKSCELYRKGKLEGIHSLMASTPKENPRNSHHDKGVIMFRCGPHDEEQLILEYGKKIVQLLKYTDPGWDFIPYKTSEQSADGTYATGSRSNTLYRLDLETVEVNTPDLNLEQEDLG